MREQCLLREDRDGVCYLTLNRPEKLNALDSVLFSAIDRELAELEKREDIHVIVLSGAGKAFCAGHDVAVLGAEGQDENLNARVVARLADIDKAVVVVIHSHCYTGGLELALAGDIIIVSENARIGDTHSKFALRPIWGLLQRLPRRVGVSVTKDMFCTNRVLSGREAERLGFANYCFPDETLWEEAETIIRKINGNSPFSISFMKQMLRETDGENMSVGFQREIQTVYEGILGPDFEERISVLTKK